MWDCEEVNDEGSDSSVGEDVTDSIACYNMLSNYSEMSRIFIDYAVDSYEEPYTCYYIVAMPISTKYQRDIHFYRFKGMDYLRKLLKLTDAVMTREIVATKIHINILCWSRDDLYKYNNKAFGKHYGFNVVEVHSTHDRVRVAHYMIKESHTRRFVKYKDYITCVAVRSNT